MKYSVLVLGIILLSQLVYAETTFFDSPDDAFIMGNSVTGESIQGSGGGCLTNWSCSSWSSCADGIQIRNCTKEKAYCYADLKKKPIESQNCSIDKSEDKNNTGSEDRITSSPNESMGNINNPNNPNLFSVKEIILGMFIVIVIGVVVLFVYKRHFKNIKSKASEKNISLKLKKLIGFLWNKYEKYPSNSINGLINKEVYLESGRHIGKVNDVLLGGIGIERLNIELDKKYKFDNKGIIINYRHVKCVGEIIIIDESISEHLERIKTKYFLSQKKKIQ